MVDCAPLRSVRSCSARVLRVALVVGAAGAALAAQSASVQAEFDSWNSINGGHWRVYPDREGAYARCLWGGSAAAAVSPRSDPEFFARARTALDATRAIHGVDSSTLLDESVLLLPLGLAGSTDKVRVRLLQVLGGVAVEPSFVNLLFARDGALLSIDTQALADARELPQSSSLVDRSRARELARSEFERVTGAAPSWTGLEREFVKPQVREGRRVGVRAWAVSARSERDGVLHAAYEFHLDAGSGAVLERRTLVHDFDVSGTVRTLATPGSQPDTAANPPVSHALAHVQITSSVGSVVTDANGDFNFVGASAPLPVTVKYFGPWCDSRHGDGTSYAFDTTLDAASGNQVLLNASAIGDVTAQANAHVWVSRVHDWLEMLNPAGSVPDFQARSNASVGGACNAFFLFSGSINFHRAGSFMGLNCVNMAYSSIVAHELGHWLNERYSSGNGPGGIGEGLADTYGMYLLDSPIVGEDYCGAGCHIRTGLNTRPFCGDEPFGCYANVHEDGQVLMGALWKVRSRLKASLGASAGAMTADALFSGWLNGYDDDYIGAFIAVHYLTLDDDDGNIANGTPNYLAIDGGFREQGFPGVPITECVPNFVSYCTSSTTTGGCAPTMTFSGTPSATAPTGCVLLAYSVDGQRSGLFFYGMSGRAALPWSVGSTSWFCVKSPVQRTTLHGSGGNTGACNGNLAVDWNQFRATHPGGLSTAIVPTVRVQAQAWFRDPAAPKSTNLSNALEFTVCP